jgi:hypothetical protein
MDSLMLLDPKSGVSPCPPNTGRHADNLLCLSLRAIDAPPVDFSDEIHNHHYIQIAVAHSTVCLTAI